jgi:iron complex transport system permease protein
MSQRATAARLWKSVAVLLVLLLASLAVAALSGPYGGARAERFVILELRLPRALVAALVGAGLASCGLAFQALLRNPLASPYLLGVSGGGSLGAVIAILLGVPALLPGWPTLPLFAFGGCLAAIGIIHLAATRRGHLLPHDLLLAGVVANSFFLALMAVLHYVADPTQTARIVTWTLGSIRVGSVPLWLTASLMGAGLAVLATQAHAMNLLCVGDETAAQLGVDVDRARRLMFLAASVMTGAAVAVSGPVGFVGLFVPHGVRFVLGSDHRILLPACFLSGASFLVLADTAARAAFAPREIPVGVLTAVVGAPAFFVLMVRSRYRRAEGGSA